MSSRTNPKAAKQVTTTAGQRLELWHGDALEVLKKVPDASVHAVVTDPPYGLAELAGAQVAEVVAAWAGGDRAATPPGRGFAGNGWDAFVPPPALWDEVYRVLKPGGHAAVFAGARTQDLMGLALRLAGFEIRDTKMWLYSSGLPKSANVSKNIDRSKGERCEPVGKRRMHDIRGGKWAGAHDKGTREVPVYGAEPVTAEAKAWQGWGSALKPAYEPILLARKPLQGTLTANVLAHGVGALNIDGCRVDSPDGKRRWPANVSFSHSPDCDTVAGGCAAGCQVAALDTGSGAAGGEGPSRFFYIPKPPKAEKPRYTDKEGNVVAHVTVKPVGLMRQLVRLVTPPGGVVLEPFAGSGTTVEAALLEPAVGRIIAVEAMGEYIPLTVLRTERAVAAEPGESGAAGEEGEAGQTAA